jgi:hypothetical protein
MEPNWVEVSETDLLIHIYLTYPKLMRLSLNNFNAFIRATEAPRAGDPLLPDHLRRDRPLIRCSQHPHRLPGLQVGQASGLHSRTLSEK